MFSPLPSPPVPPTIPLPLSSELPSTSPSVLLLGEGNFSFCLSLAELLKKEGCLGRRSRDRHRIDVEGTENTDELSDDTEMHQSTADLKDSHIAAQFLEYTKDNVPCPVNIYGTSFDSLAALDEKYPEHRGIAKRLGEFEEVFIVNEVNAWQLPFEGHLFDRIIWNHPHLGVEDFRLHRFLLSHFFHESSKYLKKDSLLIITLVEGQFERWGVKREAAKHLFQLRSISPFVHSLFPGYQSKRNKTGQSFQNSHTLKHTQSDMRSWKYVFTRSGNKIDNPLREEGEREEQEKSKLGSYEMWQEEEEPGGMGKERRVRETDNYRMSEDSAADDGYISDLRDPSKLLSFRCDKCPRVFGTSQGLFTHNRQVHDLLKYGIDWSCRKEPSVLCERCGRRFGDEEAKWQHLLSQHLSSRIPPHPGPLFRPSEVPQSPEESPNLHFPSAHRGKKSLSLVGNPTASRPSSYMDNCLSVDDRNEAKSKRCIALPASQNIKETNADYPCMKNIRKEDSSKSSSDESISFTNSAGDGSAINRLANGKVNSFGVGMREKERLLSLSGLCLSSLPLSQAKEVTMTSTTTNTSTVTTPTTTMTASPIASAPTVKYSSSSDCTSDSTPASTSPSTPSSQFYACSICGQAVPALWSTAQHLEFLKPLVGLEAKCEICGKVFGEYRAVYQHRTFCEFYRKLGARENQKRHKNEVEEWEIRQKESKSGDLLGGNGKRLIEI